MRVLLVHNRYRAASTAGEDRVYDQEAGLLEDAGDDVIRFEATSDGIGTYTMRQKAIQGLRTFWSHDDAARITQLLRDRRPDIVHVHNIWPLISPSVVWACRRYDVPVVMRMPNFRLFCVNGHLVRSGKDCERCIGRSLMPGVVHGCGGSMTRSVALAGSATFHRLIGTWIRGVDAFIAPSRFVRSVALSAGIDRSRLFVKPNFVPLPKRTRIGPGDYFLFLGRLEDDKGPDLAITAMTAELGSLVLAGAGPMDQDLAAAADRSSASIRLVGRQSPERCSDLLAGARALVVPSRIRETFGLVVPEAYAHGVPVVAAGHGALVESVQDGVTGFVFEPRSAEDLRSKMRRMLDDSTSLSMGQEARRLHAKRYGSKTNLELLHRIYRTVIGRSRTRAHPWRHSDVPASPSTRKRLPIAGL